MPTPTVRVIAAEDSGLLPYVTPEGRAVRGRYVGRAGAPPFAPRAESVAESNYILRALARGDLVPAPEAPPAPSPALPETPADAAPEASTPGA